MLRGFGLTVGATTKLQVEIRVCEGVGRQAMREGGVQRMLRARDTLRVKFTGLRR